jgi:hypothetical protein
METYGIMTMEFVRITAFIIPYLPKFKTTLILRKPPQTKHVCQGKMYLSKSKMIPKKSAKKRYFTVNFRHLIHTACQILSTFTSVTAQPSQLVPSLSSYSLLTYPSSSLPFHNISSSVSSTALDIQYFLKPFRITSGEMCCHAIMIQSD